MKKKKNKLIKLLKTGIIFLIISLLFSNCQNENGDIVDLQQKNKFEKLFNSKIVSQNLGFETDNLYIDWQSPEILEINKNGNGGLYQFNIELIEKVINNSDLFVNEIFYKLIINEKEEETKFTILRFEPFKNSLNITPSETNLQDFSGMKFIFNEIGVAQDIYTYIKGEKIASFNETKRKRKNTNIILSKADDSDFNNCLDLNGNLISGCSDSDDTGNNVGAGGGYYVAEYERNYTDWYRRCNDCTPEESLDGVLYFYNGYNYIYTGTTEQGISIRWVWTHTSNNRYLNVFDSRIVGSGVGPNFAGRTRTFDEDEVLPCPIGWEKIGNTCVKIVEDDQIINNLTEKEKCVYDKLKALNLFTATIKKFENNSSYNLIIKRGNCENTDTGCTDGGDISNGNITITMEEGVNGRPLDFASDLLHEGIHAEIFKYVDEHKKGIDPNNRENLMYYYWLEKKKGDPRYFDANYQHQHMADNYIKPLTEALRRLDNYNYPLDYYLGFAWTGLQKYGFDDYWENGKLVKLTTDKIKEYEKKSGIVRNNTKFNGDDCK